MLINPHLFQFTRDLEANFAVFRDEFLGMRQEDFLRWPDHAAYGGEWLVAPLFMSSHFPGIERHFAQNQARCPRTMALLRSMPDVTTAAFSWMQPGCHIYSHKDVKHLSTLRAHLPIEAPVGARMRVGAEFHTWREAECLLFDGYIEHETVNEAPVRRVVLLVDACLVGNEFAQLEQWRREHALQIEPQLVLVHPFTRKTIA